MSNPLKEFVVQNFQDVNPESMNAVRKWANEFIGSNFSKIVILMKPYNDEPSAVQVFNQMCEVRDQIVHAFNKDGNANEILERYK